MESQNSNIRHQNRNRQTGQYSYDGRLDRLCRCGFTLGKHTAEAPHIIDDLINGVQHFCPKFRPLKTSKK